MFPGGVTRMDGGVRVPAFAATIVKRIFGNDGSSAFTNDDAADLALRAARHASGRFRREDAFIDRAGFSNETCPLEVSLRDKLNNFAHVESPRLENQSSTTWSRVFRTETPALSQEVIFGRMPPGERLVSLGGQEGNGLPGRASGYGRESVVPNAMRWRHPKMAARSDPPHRGRVALASAPCPMLNDAEFTSSGARVLKPVKLACQ